MKYKAIIYDIDGTLLDTAKMNMIPLQQLIKEEQNKTVAYDNLLPYAAFSGLKTIEMLGFKDVEGMLKKWIAKINTSGLHAEIFDGIQSVLDAVQELGITQAIMSSKTKKQYQIDITENHLDHYFQFKTLLDDTELHKPNPEPLYHILEQLQLRCDEVLYNGDTDADAKCCKAANVDFAYASWGPLSIEETATYVLDKPEDLMLILK